MTPVVIFSVLGFIFVCTGIIVYYIGPNDVALGSVIFGAIWFMLAIFVSYLENNWLNKEISYERYSEIKEIPKDILNKYLQDNIITNYEYHSIKNDFEKQQLNELKRSLLNAEK